MRKGTNRKPSNAEGAEAGASSGKRGCEKYRRRVNVFVVARGGMHVVHDIRHGVVYPCKTRGEAETLMKMLEDKS